MKKIIVIAIVVLMSCSVYAKGGGGHGSSGHASSGHSSSSGGHTTSTAAKGSTTSAKPAEPARTTSWFPWFGGSHGGSTSEEKCKKEKTC